MPDDVLRFGKIEIIEWLRPGDMKTGRVLFDEIEPVGISSMPAIGAQYRQVWTRAEFLAALREIVSCSSAQVSLICRTPPNPGAHDDALLPRRSRTRRAR